MARPPVEDAVSVVIADDNAVLRLGLRAMFDKEPRIRIVGEASDCASAVALAAVHRPDLLLLEVRAPGADGAAALALIGPPTRVAVLSAVSDPDMVVRVVAAGARSYLVHGWFGQQELIDAVLATAAGSSALSPPAAAALVGHVQAGRSPDRPATELTSREREVLTLMAEGLSNGQIAERLTISGKTVKNHVHHVYKRLRAENREQAVALWNLLRANVPPSSSGRDSA